MRLRTFRQIELMSKQIVTEEDIARDSENGNVLLIMYSHVLLAALRWKVPAYFVVVPASRAVFALNAFS